MSTTITKGMEETQLEMSTDAKDDVGVNKTDSHEGEKIEILGLPQKTEEDEKNTDKDHKDREDEGDRHVILTPSRRIRISSLRRLLTRQGQEP